MFDLYDVLYRNDASELTLSFPRRQRSLVKMRWAALGFGAFRGELVFEPVTVRTSLLLLVIRAVWQATALCSKDSAVQLMIVGQAACNATQGFDRFPFCNLSLSIESRIDDLLSRINDSSKPNLLTARGGPRGLESFKQLGVPPFYWGHNCIQAAGTLGCTTDGRCPTSFPSGPSFAATFDLSLIHI